MKRIYHSHTKWEDHQHGMYALTCANSPALAGECAAVLKNEYLLYTLMRHCAMHWTHSAAVNLSNPSRNRQAWLGQAACCYAHGAPEFVTKMAWRNLNDVERMNANIVADTVIKEWEKEYGDHANQTALFADETAS